MSKKVTKPTKQGLGLEPPIRTRLAILRTMGALHTESLQYDLKALQAIVQHLAPDLLCAEITREAWELGDLSGATLEVREALAPVIALTDTVLVPVAPSADQFSDFRAPPGFRQSLARLFERLLRLGQRSANSPEGIHGPAFEVFCHTVCALEEMTWTEADRAAYREHTEALGDNILKAVNRDPGGRVLVVVQCQWHHTLEPLLEQAAENIEIVDYRDL